MKQIDKIVAIGNKNMRKVAFDISKIHSASDLKVGRV